MVIHDRSYSRWTGSRDGTVPAVSVLWSAGLRRGITILFRKKLPALLLLLAAYGPFIFMAGALYVRAYVLANADKFPVGLASALQEPEFAEMLAASPDNAFSYMFLFQWPFVLLGCVLLGSGLIAEDRRANALELYLSRPVTVRQYLLGKLAIIGTFLAAVTVIPAAVLILIGLSLSWGQPGEALALIELLGRTILAGAIWVAVPSLLIVTASALASRARNAAILWIAVVVMLEFVASNILIEVFGNERFSLLKIGFNVQQVGAWIMGSASNISKHVPVWQSALVLLGWVALCVPVMLRRVRPVEVVA
ncbi:MAG: ABC transporter permease [Planctomycetota bacterium]